MDEPEQAINIDWSARERARRPKVTVDERLVAPESIDTTRTVLMDMHSLHVAIHKLLEKPVPSTTVGPHDLYTPILAHVVQSLVLHERIVVDSLLFQRYPDLWKAYDLFPGVIRALYLPHETRFRIGVLVDSLTKKVERTGPPELSDETWSELQSQSGHEKSLINEVAETYPSLVPPGYENDPAANLKATDKVYLPSCVRDSSRTLPRTHFYLELARELGIPLAVDPARSRYFEVLTTIFKQRLREGSAENVIAKFEAMTLKPGMEELEGIVSVDLSIPAVAEYVFRHSQRHRCTLHESVLEIRHSKHACAFREWCARLFSLESQGRAGAKEQMEMYAGLKELCEIWKRDVKEGVVYKSRKINLEKLFLIGGVLKAMNMNELITIKDPIIWPSSKNAYFLFLNDLIRPIS